MNTYKNSLNHFLNLVDCLEKIPNVGKKSAFKMAYHLGLENPYLALKITHALENALENLKTCSSCNALSESEVCEICSDESRQNSQLCMVLHPRDVFILEDLKDFLGRYYVLNSIEGVDFNALEKRLIEENIKEIIFAFPPTLANDSLMLYIEDKLQHFHLTFTKIAQGVPTGVNFENIDSVSLSRAFNSRIKA